MKFVCKKYPCNFTHPPFPFLYETYTALRMLAFFRMTCRCFCIIEDLWHTLTAIPGSLAYPYSAPVNTWNLAYPGFSTYRFDVHFKTRHLTYPDLLSIVAVTLPRPDIWYTHDYMHIYQPSRWWCYDVIMVRRFRRTPTPMEECTYFELILLCTFELEHCCFVLKICDISTAPITRSTNGKYFEHIEFNYQPFALDLLYGICPCICCAEFVLYVVMNFCIDLLWFFVTFVHLRLPIAQWVYWWAVTSCVLNCCFVWGSPSEW